jgi:hypothetical protein
VTADCWVTSQRELIIRVAASGRCRRLGLPEELTSRKPSSDCYIVALRWGMFARGVGVRTTMKWFRFNIRHGARLALLALAVQFVLSFGHSHWFARAAIQSSPTQIDDGQGAAAGNRELRLQPPLTKQDGDNQQPDDHCAICAVIGMAKTVPFATPPLLLLPQAVELLYLTTDTEFDHLKTPPSFQPRAPPVS